MFSALYIFGIKIVLEQELAQARLEPSGAENPAGFYACPVRGAILMLNM